MMAIITALLGALDPIARIGKSIENVQIAKANAQTDSERAQLEAKEKALSARRDVLVEESKYSRLNLYVRAAFAAPTVILLVKLELYDKAFGQWTGGHTDPLGDRLWDVIMLQLSFYFVYEAITLYRRMRG